MKGLSLIAQFNFQRAASVSAQKQLPLRGTKNPSADGHFFLGVSDPGYQSGENINSPQAVNSVLAVQSVLPYSEGRFRD